MVASCCYSRQQSKPFREGVTILSMSKISLFITKYWQPITLILLAITSKFVGFLRNAFIAYYFGTSPESDLLGLLLLPTDFVTAYLINQTIITSLTIFFGRSSEGKRDIFLRTFHFYRVILILASVILGVVMVTAYPHIPWYYSVLAATPGVFYGMAGIIQSYLNYNRVFLWPGAQELIAHVFLLVGVVIAWKYGIFWYVVVMLGTGILRVGILLPDLRKFLKGKQWVRELFAFQKVRFEPKLLWYISPIVLTFILSGIPNFVILSKLFSAGEGYIAAHNYANKIIGLFNPIVVIPLTTYLIPTMQRWIEEKKSITTVNTAVFLLIGGLSLVSAVVLVVAPNFIISLIYARGSFATDSTELTGNFLRFQAFAMVGYALMYYLLQLTLLQGNMRKLILSFVVGTLVILFLLAILPFAPYISVGISLTIGVMVSVLMLL